MQGWEQRMGAGPFSAERIKHNLLLVPEAPVLSSLIVIGWVFGFPPAIGGITALVVALFVVRLFCLASAAQELGQARYQQADRLATSALRLNPWSSDAHALRANAQLLQGNDEAAEVMLRDALRLAPAQPASHAALATVLLERGDFAGGREHATRALRLDATSPYAVQQLAWLALHRDQDPARAGRIVNTIDLHGQPSAVMVSLLVLRAEAEIAQGNLDEAREVVATIESSLPQCPRPMQAELYYHLGRLEILLGEDGGAHFRQSIRLDPHGRLAHAAWRAAVSPGELGYPRVAS